MASETSVIDAVGVCIRARLVNGPSDSEVNPTVDLWLLAFRDVSDEELQRATLAWIIIPEKGRWWPTPADLRAQIPRLQSAALSLETADPVKGRDRWPEIVRQAGSIGRACPDWPEVLAARIGVKDSERLRRAIDDAGGWRNLCLADHDATRASMGRRFAASWDRQARATAAGLLSGAPQRALEGAGSDDREGGRVVDLMGELERRKRLGTDRG